MTVTAAKILGNAMLCQAGYLTIKSCDPESGVYTQGIPNREVTAWWQEANVCQRGVNFSHEVQIINGWIIRET